MITIDPQFDLERYHDDSSSTRSAKNRSSNRISVEKQDPFGDVFAMGSAAEQQDNSNPFDDSNALKTEVEEPYHVFSKREKWLVVIIIGVAGMFSGLSSNIYFPSLDAIARVSNLNFTLLHAEL